MRSTAIGFVCLFLMSCATAPRVRPRLQQRIVPGQQFSIDGILPKPVAVLVTPAAGQSDRDLLIHFHGASWVPFQSVGPEMPLIVASVHLGAGSSVYEKPMSEPDAFLRLIAAIETRVGPLRRIHLSAFSAGYGAVRAILRAYPDRVDSVLLLDGLHTGYTDDCGVEVEKMEPFLSFAARAVAGEKRLVITHSDIAPATYASTTDTADYLLRVLRIPRVRVHRTGLGLEQVSEASRGRFLLMGFAGHTAPDHIDHLHAMPGFLRLCFEADSGG